MELKIIWCSTRQKPHGIFKEVPTSSPAIVTWTFERSVWEPWHYVGSQCGWGVMVDEERMMRLTRADGKLLMPSGDEGHMRASCAAHQPTEELGRR